jgi:hypothetical protein
VALSVPPAFSGRTRLFTGALLCAVRTFLSYVAIRSIARLVVAAKVSEYYELSAISYQP